MPDADHRAARRPPPAPGRRPRRGRRAHRAASERVRADLDAAADRAQGDSADLLHATAAIAADPTLVADAVQRVIDDHLVPERAVWEAADAVAAQFEALGGYFAERTRDIADVRDRLVAELTGPAGARRARARRAVRARRASTSRPPLVATLDTDRVLAIVTAAGGPTVAHRDPRPRARHPGGRRRPRCSRPSSQATTLVLVDGAGGHRHRRPRRRAGRGAPARWPRRCARSTATGAPPTATASSCSPTWATPPTPQAAAAAGAEGVGLFRTEFAFLDRDEAPEHRRAGRRLPARARRVRGPQGRHPHARRRRRQAHAVPAPATPRSTPRWACAACAPPRGTPRSSRTS